MKKIAKAFSLIELSIVIMIVGVIIAGTIKGGDMILEYKISKATTLTKGSKVNSIPGLSLWYETSLKDSFLEFEGEDGQAISRWNDINSQSTSKLHAYSASKATADSSEIFYAINSGATQENTSGPTYIEKGINGLPTLNFDSDANAKYQYVAVDKNFRNAPNSDMTLFVVLRWNSGSGWPIDRTCHDINFAPISCSLSTLGGNPLFGLKIDDAEATTYFRGDNLASYSNGSINSGEPYIFTLEREFGISYKTYVNGTLNGSSTSNVNTSITMDPPRIGFHMENNESIDVDISEFIFFEGRVNPKNRKAVENYLGKKYNITITH